MKSFALFSTILLLSSCGLNKSFPRFNLKDSNNLEFSGEFFKGRKSVVIMGHLECPPMLQALKDFSYFSEHIDTSDLQLITILENTSDHVIEFYGDSINTLGYLRSQFEIDTLNFPLLAECKTENVEYKDSIQIRGSHCRKLAWRLWTFSSPTISLIDQEGNIVKRKKGYPLFGEPALRRTWIEDFVFN